jgi:hypothetical protein
MKRTKRIVLSVVLMVAITLVMTYASAQAQPAAKEKTLKIGLVTNFGWSLGFDFKKGVELIAEDDKNIPVQVPFRLATFCFVIATFLAAYATAAIIRITTTKQMIFFILPSSFCFLRRF